MNSIKTRIQESQHEQQAFKMNSDNPLEIARILCAFANTQGGRLLIGVKENGKITGTLPEEERHRIEEIAKSFCQPAVKFTTHEWQEDFRLVLEVLVAPNPSRFVMTKDENADWKSYIRFEDATLKANKIQLKLWKLEQQPIEKPLLFKERESIFLKTLSDYSKPVNLSKLYKLLESYSKKDIDNSLAMLIHWEMINWKYEDDAFKYFITKY